MARAGNRRRSRTRGASHLTDPLGLRTRLLRPELVGTALVVLAAAMIPMLLPLAGVFRDARDSLIETAGLNIFTATVVLAVLGVALVLGRAQLFAEHLRHLVGVAVLLVFTAGLLGRWYPDQQVGTVDLGTVSSGGDVGRWLTADAPRTLLWLSMLPLGFSLLWPKTARDVLAATPGVVATAALWIWSLELQHWPGRAMAALRRRSSQPGSGEDTDPFAARRATIEDMTTQGPAQLEPIRLLPAGETLSAAEVAEEDEDLPPAVQIPMDMEHEARQWRHSADGWQLPPITLLAEAPAAAIKSKQDNERRAQLIVETLGSFGVDADVTQINEGPTITQFGVEPGWDVRTRTVVERDPNGQALLDASGQQRTKQVEVSRTRIRVNRITSLQNDLALALAAPALRIEAPVPGKSVVGIEVPNHDAAVVTLRSVLESRAFADTATQAALPIALGSGVSGEAHVADLATMPHLLIAGATGSGKSVCLNSIIASLLMNYSPEQLRLVMIDPKRVELTNFAAVPHLAFSEIVVDMDKVVGTLQAVINEMESRYRRFAKAGARNIARYNEQNPRGKLPYWVVVIDELADLMLAAPYQVELQLVRLAQLARATGIHLIVATQRPSVDVITGLIKANFPTRIAFAVASQVDSRTILDSGGAEKLLGKGDMLYVPTDKQKPVRLQGVYVSDQEIESVVDFWTHDRFQSLVPEMHDELLEEAQQEIEAQEAGGGDGRDVADPMVTKALEVAREHDRISTSLLQRRLRIGYPRAARVMDELESQGVVGQPEGGGGSRPVLLANEDTKPGDLREPQPALPGDGRD